MPTTRLTMLQFGRGVVTAEDWHGAAVANPSRRRASIRPRCCYRGRPEGDDAIRQRPDGFNSAAVLLPRKTCRVAFTKRDCVGFNSAAVLLPRKTTLTPR